MRRGLTLIEIVISLAILAMIGGIVVVAMDPFRQVASARNAQRELHLQALMNAIRQNIAESGTGSFICAAGPIPASPTRMAASGGYDIGPCLVPAYVSALPYDPKDPAGRYASPSDYDTGYLVSRSTSTGQVTLSAPSAEIGETVRVIR